MDAGKLNDRVILKTISKTSDGYGGFTDSVSTNKTIWANVQDISGEIKSENGRRSWNTQIEIICRKKAVDSVNPRTHVLQVEGNATEYRINEIFNTDQKYYTKILATKIL